MHRGHRDIQVAGAAARPVGKKNGRRSTGESGRHAKSGAG